MNGVTAAAAADDDDDDDVVNPAAAFQVAELMQVFENSTDTWSYVAAAAANVVVATPAAAFTGDRADASPLMELGALEKVMVVTGKFLTVAHLQAAAHLR
jgi:hypothetical protein